MSDGSWRRLLLEYSSGRIDAGDFHDRFLEIWRQARDAGQVNPETIEDLFFVVEDFCPDPQLRTPGDTDEATLAAAVQQTLLRLETGRPGGTLK